MSGIRFPAEYRIATLQRNHGRQAFDCGESRVEQWLKTKALQHQAKHLSVTRVLVDADDAIAAFFTLATGQVDFGDLPPEIVRRLPHRALPVAVLAWLGVDRREQGRGLGRLMLARALRDCHESGQTFAFVAVVLDCINPAAKRFYRQWDFRELPGRPNRLFLGWNQLATMMEAAPGTDSANKPGSG